MRAFYGAMFLLLCNWLVGFDTKNHVALTNAAINQSQIFKDFLDEFNLTINDSIDNSNSSKTVASFVNQGAIDEDGWMAIDYSAEIPQVDFSASILRTLNHFFDPIYEIPLNDPCALVPNAFRGAPAPEWAIQSSAGHFINNYSLYEMRNYLYDALTSQDRQVRQEKFQNYFSAIGHILHLLQDMAVPAHVRNDNHAPKLVPDGYFSVKDVGMDRFESFLSKSGSTAVPPPPSYGKLNSYRSYWHNEDGTGLADFTNRNFVSQDTNLDHNMIDCREPLIYAEPIHEGFEDEDIPIGKKQVAVRYYYNTVHDYFSGEDIRNVHLSVSSLWNFITEDFSNRRLFSLNDACHIDYAKLLLPRALAYSVDLLDFMFRGHLTVKLEEGTSPDKQLLSIQNNSDDDESLSHGFITVVAHYPYNSQDQADDTWIVFGTYYLDALDNINSDSGASWQQELSIPSIEGIEDFIIIYRGGLGEEDNEIIVKQYTIQSFGFLKIESASISLIAATNETQTDYQCQPSSNPPLIGSIGERMEDPGTYRHYIGTLKYFGNAKLKEIHTDYDCGTLIIDGQTFQGNWVKSNPSAPNPISLELILDATTCPMESKSFWLRFEDQQIVQQPIPGNVKRTQKHTTYFSASPITDYPYPECRCLREYIFHEQLNSRVDWQLNFIDAKVIDINDLTEDTHNESSTYLQFKNGYARRTDSQSMNIEDYGATMSNNHVVTYSDALDMMHLSCSCTEWSYCWDICQYEEQYSLSIDALKSYVCDSGHSDLALMYPILANEYQDTSLPEPLHVSVKYYYPAQAKMLGYEQEILDIPILRE